MFKATLISVLWPDGARPVENFSVYLCRLLIKMRREGNKRYWPVALHHIELMKLKKKLKWTSNFGMSG